MRFCQRVKWVVVICTTVLTMSSVCRAEVEAITKPRHDLLLGLGVDGKVKQLKVKSGDSVKEGDVLIVLDDEVGEATVERLKIQAQSTLTVDEAKGQLDLALVEKKFQDNLAENGANSPIEVERADTVARIRKIQWNQAREEHELAQVRLKEAQAAHDSNIMRAPRGGIINQIIVEEGEPVQRERPILHLVEIDPLWIDAAVPTADTLVLKVGGSVWVTQKLAGMGNKPIEGKIIYLAEVADAASDTRLVRIEMPNTNRTPAGTHVIVAFSKPDGLASAEHKSE